MDVLSGQTREGKKTFNYRKGIFVLKTRWNSRQIAPVLILFALLLGMVILFDHPFTSASTDPQAIGYVDFHAIFLVHPDKEKAEAALEERAIAMQMELEEKAQEIEAEEQEQLLGAYQRQLEELEQELIAEVVEGIHETISQVAKEEGFLLVLDASHVLYGGVDLTPLVLERLDL